MPHNGHSGKAITDRRERAGLAFATVGVFLILLSVYLLTHGGDFFITDGVVMFRTTEALVDRHTLVLEPDSGLSQIVAGQDGQHYSKYGIGQPLAATVPYYLAKVVHPAAFSYMWHKAVENYLVSLFNQIVTAFTGALVVLLAYRLGNGLRLSVGLAFAWGFCTLAWPYSKTFFSEPLFTCCLVLATLGLLAYNQSSGTGRFAWLAAAGFALGYAVLVRVAGLILLAPFGAYFVWASMRHAEGALIRSVWDRVRRVDGAQQHSWQQFTRDAIPAALSFGLPIAASLIIVVWHNIARFGNVFDEGYLATDETFSTPLLTGLAGLLLSPGKSIFLYVPLTILAVVGWQRLWKEQPATAALWSGLIAVTLVQTALWWAWWGGWNWGPRLLVPVLPFVVVSLGTILRQSHAARIAVWPFALAGLVVALLGVLVDFNPYLADLMVQHPGRRIGTEDPGVYFDPALSPIIAHVRFLLNGEHWSVVTFDMERLGFNTGAKYAFWSLTGFIFFAGVSALAWADRFDSQHRRHSGKRVAVARSRLYTS